MAMAPVVLHRSLEGLGFHVKIQTHASIPDLPAKCTRWAMIEDMPPSVFIDFWQLRRLNKDPITWYGGADGGIALWRNYSYETLVDDAPRAVALVHGAFLPEEHEPNHRHMRSTMPAQMRYLNARSHGPDGEDTHDIVELPPPAALYICCQNAEDGVPPPPPSPPPPRTSWSAFQIEEWCPPLGVIGGRWSEACGEPRLIQPCGEWRRVESLSGETLKKSIPVGNSDQAMFQIVVTQLFIWGACIYLIVFILRLPPPFEEYEQDEQEDEQEDEQDDHAPVNVASRSSSTSRSRSTSSPGRKRSSPANKHQSSRSSSTKKNA